MPVHVQIQEGTKTGKREQLLKGKDNLCMRSSGNKMTKYTLAGN